MMDIFCNISKNLHLDVRGIEPSANVAAAADSERYTDHDRFFWGCDCYA